MSEPANVVPSAKSKASRYARIDNALLQKPILGGQPLDENFLIITAAHLGDANDNGIVDIQDLTVIANNWQKIRNNWATGDLNLDGLVDIQDFTIVANNWQQTSPLSLVPDPDTLPSLTFSSVPEPASLALLAIPLLLRKRRFP